MAKFLDTQAISNELTRLIKEAKEKIILISPFLKANIQIQERLKTKGKLGTLSEIVIVYGKSELKESELSWIKEIDDLKLYEKNNLHAKCYVNEDKAIICSMNLYDYSQQNNIEMGILITKEQDKDVYEELVDEINNIKVNGKRIGFDKSHRPYQESTILEKPPVLDINSLPVEKRLRILLLKEWRNRQSKVERSNASVILTDEEMVSIITSNRIDFHSIQGILSKRKASKYTGEILNQLENANYYTIGRVINLWYQTDPFSYDRVKLKISSSSEEKWFDTTQELPNKDRLVAVKINKTWFNEYLYLDE